MEYKDYPVIIQTWLPGQGCVIFTGEFSDPQVMKWAKHQVLEWNSHSRPREGEIYLRQSHYQRHRLFGILRQGGKEDFGRSFTEIRAVLVDDKAQIFGQAELQQKLLAITIDSQDKNEWQLSLPYYEPARNKNADAGNADHQRSNKGAKGKKAMIATLLLFFLGGMGFVLNQGGWKKEEIEQKSEEKKASNHTRSDSRRSVKPPSAQPKAHTIKFQWQPTDAITSIIFQERLPELSKGKCQITTKQQKAKIQIFYKSRHYHSPKLSRYDLSSKPHEKIREEKWQKHPTEREDIERIEETLQIKQDLGFRLKFTSKEDSTKSQDSPPKGENSNIKRKLKKKLSDWEYTNAKGFTSQEELESFIQIGESLADKEIFEKKHQKLLTQARNMQKKLQDLDKLLPPGQSTQSWKYENFRKRRKEWRKHRDILKRALTIKIKCILYEDGSLDKLQTQARSFPKNKTLGLFNSQLQNKNVKLSIAKKRPKIEFKEIQFGKLIMQSKISEDFCYVSDSKEDSKEEKEDSKEEKKDSKGENKNVKIDLRLEWEDDQVTILQKKYISGGSDFSLYAQLNINQVEIIFPNNQYQKIRNQIVSRILDNPGK